ncbi:MAG: sugar transferase [Chloroflexi bacterium]|nr:sugar transferase [Chloroflexota bacterium]
MKLSTDTIAKTHIPPTHKYGLPVKNTFSTKVQWRLYRACLLFTDALLIGLAFWLAYRIRFGTPLPFFQLEIIPAPVFYLWVALGVTLVWLLVFAISGLYYKENLLGGTKEYALVFRSITTGMLVVIVAGFLEPTFILARGWLLLAWGTAILLVGAGRFSLRRVVYWQRKKGCFLSPAILVGANQEGKLLAEQLWSWLTTGLHIVGVVDDNVEKGIPIHKHIQVLGGLDDLEQIIVEYQVEEIILATSALSREQMLKIFRRFGFSQHINLRLSSGLFEIISTGLRVKEIGYVPLMQLNHVRMAGLDRVMKLALDYGITIPGLIILSPFFLLVALVVKLDSPGPLIYRRRVMGINGQEFDAFKFRTMRQNGEEILDRYPEKKLELAQNHKIVDDPRITRVGHFLRKFSLDEFPQLINIIRGEMSLVGPRMISPPEMEEYGRWGMNLLTVRPGITGLWQTSGRSDVDYEERVRLDMNYIRNWTIWVDFQLLFRTIPAVIKSEGAY